MPKEVPPNISQVFKDIFPLSAVIIIIYALDLLSRTFIHKCSERRIKNL